MAEKDKQIIELKEEIGGLKEQTTKMEAETLIKERRILAAELLNEMFASLPLENSIKLLVKIPNGLLARNAQKMIISIKTAVKGNKWNEADCGPALTISEDGLIVTYSGSNGRNMVRANLPLPSFKLIVKKPSIIFYFEMEILKKTGDESYAMMGFCFENYPLKEQLIEGNNSGEGSELKPANFIVVSEGDVLGFGIIIQPNSSIECFATFNGKFHEKGKYESPSPPTLADLQRFPFASLYNDGASIRTNFGKDEWRFKQFKDVLEKDG